MMAQRYLRAISAGGVTQVLTVVLGFVALWLTTLLLQKQAFGEFMVAFAVVSVVSLVLAAGPQGLVLYHTSRADSEQQTFRVVSACLQLVLLFGTGLSVLLWLAADATGGLIGKPGVTGWLSLLVPFVVLDAVLRVLTGWDQGRQRVVRTALFRDVVPLGVRCAVLGGLLALPVSPAAGEILVAVAYVAGAGVALGLLVILQRGVIWWQRGRLGAWDYKYLAQLTLNGLVTKPQRSFDILLMGAMASATATADYAVASRLANVLMIPKQVVALLLVPRFGWLLANGGETQLTREFDACRGLVLLTTMAGIIGFALGGPTVLGLFGGEEDYQAAFHVLLILSVAMLVRSAFGHGVQLLNQAGMAGWTLLSTLAASAALVVGMVVGVPILGAVGGAWAVTLSAVVSHGLIALVLYARPGLSTMRSGVALVLACSAAVLIMMATGMLGPLAAALALAMCSAGLAALYAGEARRVLGILRNRHRPVAG